MIEWGVSRWVYIYLMKIRVTYESLPVGPGVKPFERRVARPKERRLMFDYKLLIDAINTIARTGYEIKLTRMLISLQRTYPVPVQ
jgi:hypothetical protein